MRQIILATMLSFSMLHSVGCEVNPATGRSQLLLVSGSQLDAMGAEAAPMLVQEFGGEVSDPELRRYIDEIGQRLVRFVEGEYQEIQWRFVALDSDVMNAFALPGGRVFVSRGLLAQLSNEAEVAAVLGHEIGHVTGRHVDERISRATAIDMGLQLGGAMTESQLAMAAAGLFGQGYLLSFSRDQESEADRLGIRYMSEAGYDPHAVLGVLNVLLQAREGGRSLEILATHPNPETRIRQAERILNREYREARNNPQYQLHEERFRQRALPYLRTTRQTSLGAVGGLGGVEPQSVPIGSCASRCCRDWSQKADTMLRPLPRVGADSARQTPTKMSQ